MERSPTSVKVVVPVTSLCPLLLENLRLRAHNQRSHVTVTARNNDFVWIEEIVQLVEQEASCELYGLLKRPDEKHVTERAYDNPKFVEDMVRDDAARRMRKSAFTPISSNPRTLSRSTITRPMR